MEKAYYSKTNSCCLEFPKAVACTLAGFDEPWRRTDSAELRLISRRNLKCHTELRKPECNKLLQFCGGAYNKVIHVCKLKLWQRPNKTNVSRLTLVISFSEVLPEKDPPACLTGMNSTDEPQHAFVHC